MDRNLKYLLVALLAVTAKADTTFYDAVKFDFGSSLLVNPGINVTFSPGSTVNATGATLVGFPGGTGSSSFLGLVDTPDVYSGQGGKLVAVRLDVTGLEFITAPTGGGGGGTVTSFSSGLLSPLFTTTVTNPTTTPALAFTLSTAGAHTFFGNETGGTTLPHYVQPNFTDLTGDFALTQTPSLAASSLVGRTSASSGDWQAITVSGGLVMTGTNLTMSATVGNVLNSGTPAANQLPIWVDATHIKGVNGLTGGFAGQVLKKSSSTDYEWEWATDISGSGGSSTFISLTDVPPSYSGAANKFVAVNNSANGLEFVTAPTGGGGAVTSVFGRTGAVTAVVGDYSAFFQPLDTDLTNIAALAGQTSFGQGFLTRADAAASRTYIGAGTSSFDGTWTSLTGKPTTLVGFGITDAQPLDADLTSLAATSGTNTIYYRSAANTWSAVGIGGNVSFASGTLAAGNSNWDTAYNERNQWNGGSAGLVAGTGRTSLGLDIGVNVQAFDADLSSLAGAASTNALYYRSATSTWAPVTVQAPVTFSGGILSATSAGDVVGPAGASDLGFALFSGTTGKLLRSTTSSGLVISTSGVFGTITNNSASWDTAAADALKWNGQATGLVAATGKASLGLDNVTNDVQAKATIWSNSVPANAQIPVSNGAAYIPRGVSGSGATVTLSNLGVITIDAIANASLANSSVTMGNSPAVALGGAATLDQITGMTGAAGMVKRSAANTFTTAVAGTDYKAGTQNTINIRYITATGASTYTPTAGVTALYVEGVGGGGGSGGVSISTANNLGLGGGGGGGGYAAVYIGTPAASYNVSVGIGGVAGTAAGGNGGDGGNTTFAALLTAGGGQGGAGMSGSGLVSEAAMGITGTGGVSTVGGLLVDGEDAGTQICLGASGTTVWGVSGKGGNSFFGAGGHSVAGHSAGGGAQPAQAGGKYGGGASGSVGGNPAGARAGAAGGTGLIRVWEIF